MAAHHAISYFFRLEILLLINCLLVQCFPYSSATNFSSNMRGVIESCPLYRHHTIEVRTLMPVATCFDIEQPLKVVHKYGSCSHLGRSKTNIIPTHSEMLLKDQARVASIHTWMHVASSRKSSRRKTGVDIMMNEVGIGSGTTKYIFIDMGLGTPKQELSFTFDTGANLTWTRCRSVDQKHVDQSEFFIPKISRSFAGVNCRSSSSIYNSSRTGLTTGTLSNSDTTGSEPCKYVTLNANKKSSIKFLGKERLSMASNITFENFLFGCRRDTKGKYYHPLGNVAGLLSLGQGEVSFISQTSERDGKIFSYCLPSTSSYTGYFKFGARDDDSLKYTPLVTRGFGFYGLEIVGISLGGRKLHIATSVFSKAGTIIDSMVEITRLPIAAYYVLRAEFRKLMDYPLIYDLPVLDTCYNITGHKFITIPTVTFSFKGGVEVDIDPSGILYVVNESQVCLAFTKTEGPNAALLGNVQQKTFEVVYDVGRGGIGFRPKSCS